MKNLLASFALLLAFTLQMQAQATLSVQGSIQNADNTAVTNGEYDVTFRLYETASGGTPVWSETQTIVVSGGIYSALLGEVEPLTAAFDATYYLGLTVSGGQELIPRSRLTASPYALSLIGQDNIFPSTGAVGAGTATPEAGAQLHVKNAAGDGKAIVEGSDAAIIEMKKGANTATISYDGNHISIENLNLVFNAGLELPAGQTIHYNGVSDWRLIDTDNFETDSEGWICHDRWDNSTTVQSQRIQLGGTVQNGFVLRAHINGDDALKKQLNLTGIPHTMVKVVFTYHFLDSWEGTSHNDHAFAGFASVTAPTGGQFIIGWESRNLEGHGTDYWTGALGGFNDYNTRQEMVIDNSANNLWVIITSNLNQDSFNESYAIDNVEIWVK